MKTIIYKNHTFENGIMTRGHTTKRVIKPNSKGVYKIRCKGETELLTINDIMQGYKEPEKMAIVHEPKEKFNPSIVIDLHMKGMSTTEIAKEANRTTRTITTVKAKFIGINRFETVCNNFNTSGYLVKKAYGITSNISELDAEDKLRLLSRYLKEYSVFNNKSREETCLDRGYNYRAMCGWSRYNGFEVTNETFHECMDRYEATIEERKLKNGKKNTYE